MKLVRLHDWGYAVNQGRCPSQQIDQELNLADHTDPIESEPSDKARVWAHHRTERSTEGNFFATWWRYAIEIKFLPSKRTARHALTLSGLLVAAIAAAVTWVAASVNEIPDAISVPTPILVPLILLAVRAIVTKGRR